MTEYEHSQTGIDIHPGAYMDYNDYKYLLKAKKVNFIFQIQLTLIKPTVAMKMIQNNELGQIAEKVEAKIKKASDSVH